MDAANRKKILIIDKDVETGKLYAIILSEEFEVSHAASAQVVRRHFIDKEFDLFIVGYHLPLGNSLDLIKAERKFFADKPIIMITGDDVQSIAKKAYRQGVSAIVQKPYGITDLLNKVKACLRERDC